MIDLAPLIASRPRAGLRTWLDPALRADWSSGLPRPGERGVEELASAGRGTVLRAPAQGGRCVIRSYRRGGLFGGLLPDRFLSGERAFAEARALLRLAPRGLAPRLLGLECRGGALKRMRVAVEEIAGAADLLSLASRDVALLRSLPLARAVGRAVAAMHECGVAHADLNLANILVSGSAARPAITLIDFDGARLHASAVPGARRLREVLRLCRSLDKWSLTAGAPGRVRGAFLELALPETLRREALRSGRRQHRWRSRLGRTHRSR